MQQLNMFEMVNEVQVKNLRKLIAEELREYNIKENFESGTLRERALYLNNQNNYKEYYKKLIETLLKYFPLVEDMFTADKIGIWDSGKGWHRYIIPKKQSGPIHSLAYIPDEFLSKEVN